MDKKLNLIGYVRVSTEKQNPKRQFDELGKLGCSKIFGPDKISGLKNKRPEFEKMMDYVREHDNDCIVVTELFRLGRSPLELLRVLDELGKKKINIKTLHEGIDTSTVFGEWLFKLFAVLGELEVMYNHERTRSGLRAIRKSNHRKGGRPRVLTDKQMVILKSMHANPEISIQDILSTMKIKKSTLYKYLNELKDK